MSSVRIVLIHNMVSPYRVEFFRELARTPGWHFHVLFTAARERDRQWQIPSALEFPAKVLKGMQVRWRGRYLHLNPGLGHAISSLKPDVIVVGAMGVASALALRYARRLNVPVILWWGGTRSTEAAVKGAYLQYRRWFLRRVAGAVTYGSDAREYLLNLGAPDHRVWVMGNATFDAQAYRGRVEEFRRNRDEWLAREGLPDSVVLVVGSLLPHKNPLILPDVLDRLRAARSQTAIAVIGTGPLEQALRGRAEALGVMDRLKILGHREPSDLPRYYAMARVFLHPTLRDNWGQVINEAAAAALPIVTTPAAGAVGDLIIPGETGVVVAPEPGPIAAALQRLLSEPATATGLGTAAFERLRSMDLWYSVATMRRAVEVVVQDWGRTDGNRRTKAAGAALPN